MFHKFLLSQAINIASLTIAQLIRNHHANFDIEKARSRVHEHIRLLVKPNFLGEKNVEDKMIAVADWFVDRLSGALQSGSSFVSPVLQALGSGNWDEAIELIKSFAKDVLSIRAASESGSQEEVLVSAYLEENPDALPPEVQGSESGAGVQLHTRSYSGTITDSMILPALTTAD